MIFETPSTIFGPFVSRSRYGAFRKETRLPVIKKQRRTPDTRQLVWARLDSNQGPLPYESLRYLCGAFVRRHGCRSGRVTRRRRSSVDDLVGHRSSADSVSALCTQLPRRSFLGTSLILLVSPIPVPADLLCDVLQVVHVPEPLGTEVLVEAGVYLPVVRATVTVALRSRLPSLISGWRFSSSSQ